MAYRAGDIVIVICHRIGTGYPGLAAFASIPYFSKYIDSYFKLLEIIYSTIQALAFWLLFSTSRLRIDYFRIGKAETSTAPPLPCGKFTKAVASSSVISPQPFH